MNIFLLDIRRSKKGLLSWTLISSAVIALIMLMYPAMMKSDFMELMNAKIAMLPRELADALHLSGEDFRQLPQFFAMIFQFMLMAACLYGALLGTGALLREESEGTIEFLYAKPVKRTRIVSAKLASACAQYLCFFIVLGLAGLLAGMAVRPAGIPLSSLASSIGSVVLGGMLAGFCHLFLGFAISVFFRSGRNAAAAAVALFFGTYILGSVASMGILEFLKWISPLNYFVPRDVVMNGINPLYACIILAVMAVCACIAYPVYKKKDFLI